MLIKLRRYFSEKTAKLEAFREQDKFYYALTVEPKEASKTDIKKYLTSLFDVNVLSIKKIKLPSKKVRFKGKAGERGSRHKVIVQVDKNIESLTA
jgi:ribosomal protein L23